MFSDLLLRCKESRKLVGVYSDRRDPTKFDVGIVIALDDNHFILSSVSTYGKLNGLLLYEVESVLRVDEDSIYLKKIAALMRYNNEKQEAFTADRYLPYSLLEHCRANSRIVSVDLLEGTTPFITGYVDELDVESCSIRQISEFGKPDGTASILLADVTCISCCSEYETMLEVLSSEMFDEVRFS